MGHEHQPLWVPLVVAGIGVLGTLAGGLPRAPDAAVGRPARRQDLGSRTGSREERRPARRGPHVRASTRGLRGLLPGVKHRHARPIATATVSRTVLICRTSGTRTLPLAHALGLYADRRVAAAARPPRSGLVVGENTKYDDPDDPRSTTPATLRRCRARALRAHPRGTLDPRADLTLPPPGYG